MMGLLTVTQVLSPVMNNNFVHANEGNSSSTPRVYDDVTVHEGITDEIVPLEKVAETTNSISSIGVTLPTSLDGNNIEW